VSGDRPAAVKRVRPVMERQVAHMVRLIDDLLDVSRITSGKITLRRVPTPLAEIVQGAIDAQRSAIDEAAINLTVELPAAPCIVDADPTRLVQVLSNVLHNAMKFTPAGGRIRLSRTRSIWTTRDLRVSSKPAVTCPATSCFSTSTATARGRRSGRRTSTRTSGTSPASRSRRRTSAPGAGRFWRPASSPDRRRVAP